jgi:endonuclease/exonuclease/phosphatase family metal-dependent hydrolase
MLRHLCLLLIFISNICATTLAYAESVELKVMSYNINGLPWPLKKNKKPLFMEIARLINLQKKDGTAPDVILIQEGFRPETKDMIAALDYPYVFKGPKDSDKNPLDNNKNESRGAVISGGLWILSQFPILKSDKIPFGASRCTGFDCYANKGIAYVQIQVPGVGPVDILSTHMNSNKASGSSPDKVYAIQRKQIEVAKYFFDKVTSSRVPVIFAGDFNIKTTSPTYADLSKSVPLYNTGLFCEAYGYFCKIGEDTLPIDLHECHDQHFYRESDSFRVNPVYAAKSMRQKLGDRSLSDHLAYVVQYRFDKK